MSAGWRIAVLAALLAQAASAADIAETESGDPDAPLLGAVVVVGSLLKRVDAETARAIIIVEAAELARSGQPTLAGALQQLTVNGDPVNRAYNNGGEGQSLIDLRHLGANRTLVLVDGRRWFHSIDGSIDLNTIPLGLVDRVEILKDGASAIYGSEAIGGVVNVILRHADGQQLDVYLGQYEQGDGRSHALNWSGGFSHAGWRLDLGLSQIRQDEVSAGARPISAVPVFGFPGNATLGGFGASAITPDGRYGFGPGGNLLPDGRSGTLTYDSAVGAHRPFSLNTDGYNFAPENHLLIPLETRALFARAARDLADGTRLQADLLLHRRDSAQRLAATRISTSPFASNPLERLVVPADHVHNPFGMPVTRLTLRLTDLPRAFEQQVDSWRISAGAEGNTTLAGRDWTWRAHAVHAESEAALVRDGLLSAQRVALALGPSHRDASGRARCGTPQSPIDGCIPLDAFRGQSGVTAEMLDYLRFTAQEHSGNELQVLTFDVTGELGILPAGAMAAALGLEARHEHAFRRPDPGLSNGLGEQLDPTRPVRGRSTLLEAWFEGNLPLLAEHRFAHLLELSLALRVSHYERFGTASNPQLGLRWQPSPNWLLRAFATRAFRAPSTREAFGAVAPVLAQVDDYCDARLQPDADIAARCAAQGVPADFVGDEFGFVPGRSGGNDALGPETARTGSLGLVWSGDRGINLSLDWYRIRLTDAIDTLGVQGAFDECYLFGSDAACALISRDPGSGVVLDVDARLQNLARIRVQGFDLQFGHRIDTRHGRLALRLDASYTSEHEVEPAIGSEPFSIAGKVGYWRVRANAELLWQSSPWEIALRGRHFSSYAEPCLLPLIAGQPELCDDPERDDPLFGLPSRRVGSVTYADLNLGRELPWRARLEAGVNNLLDRGPPLAFMAPNSFLPAYDIPGRYFYLAYRQQF